MNPPDYFDEHAVDMWHQLVESLERFQASPDRNRELIEAAASSYSRYRLAQEARKKTGIALIQKSDDGTTVKRNPFIVEERAALDQFTRCIQAMGLISLDVLTDSNPAPQATEAEPKSTEPPKNPLAKLRLVRRDTDEAA